MKNTATKTHLLAPQPHKKAEWLLQWTKAVRNKTEKMQVQETFNFRLEWTGFKTLS